MRNLRPTLRVLIVEDHDDSREMLEHLLSAHGHAVVVAASCAQAREAAARQPFDMVVSDIALPDGDGVELMRSLRREYLVTTIALSALTQAQDVARCEKAGVHAFLPKPVRIEELIRTITRFMIPPDVRAPRALYMPTAMETPVQPF